MNVTATAKPKRPLDRGAVFRFSRMLHTYLSAFAFLTLMFFSVTGILLNHPEWFENYEPKESSASVRLAPSEVETALKSADPNRALADAVAAKTPLLGAFASGDREEDQVLLRLEGPKGSSDLRVNLASGKVDVSTAKASLVAVLLDLHRGKNVGISWRTVIDASAYLILALSLIGFLLFFSLRFRLTTSLMLVGGSLALLIAIGIWLVP